ncbi:MAG TPA: glycosyl transferase group 1, partial [Mariniphaga sp.]|nr:glycosyl transferase group 1 [Mariniphaga sp.]
YIQARVPVLVSNRPEMAAIVRHYEIGEVTDDLTPQALAGVLKVILGNHSLLSVWKQNLERAAKDLVWEKEEAVLQEIFKKYI